MSDLLFAATAANDVVGVRAIAQARQRDGDATHGAFQSECAAFKAVDDLEVAASAATAASWPTAPLPPLRPRPEERDAHRMEESSEDDDEDGCSWSEDGGLVSNDVQVKVSIDCEETAMQGTTMPPIRLTLHLQPTVEKMRVDDFCDEMDHDMDDVGAQLLDNEEEEMEEVCLEESDALAIVGTIQKRMGHQAVVEAESLVRPLDAGSVLFTLEGQMVGKVMDIFGSVEQPHYLVSLCRNARTIEQGTRVYSTERFAAYLDLAAQTLQKAESESDADMCESENETEQTHHAVRGERLDRSSSNSSIGRKRPPRRSASRPRRTRPRWRAMEQRQLPPVPPVSYVMPSLPSGNLMVSPLPIQGVAARPSFVGFHPYNAISSLPTSSGAASQLPAAQVVASQPQLLYLWQTSHHCPPQI